jgi:hypothetical protein
MFCAPIEKAGNKKANSIQRRSSHQLKKYGMVRFIPYGFALQNSKQNLPIFILACT